MKYRLTGETCEVNGRTLHQIERTADGERGGFIEGEGNLSQDGNAWVHASGLAYEGARVVEDAQVFGKIHGHAAIRGHAELHGEAYGNSVIADHAKVYGLVVGNAAILGEQVVAKDDSMR